MQNRDFFKLSAGSSRVVYYHLEVEPSNNNNGFFKNAKEKRFTVMLRVLRASGNCWMASARIWRNHEPPSLPTPRPIRSSSSLQGLLHKSVAAGERNQTTPPRHVNATLQSAAGASKLSMIDTGQDGKGSSK